MLTANRPLDIPIKLCETHRIYEPRLMVFNLILLFASFVRYNFRRTDAGQ